MKYDDIINLKKPEPKTFRRMSKIDRAAQFGAFRALTGYEDEVSETARLTERQIFLDEYELENLNIKLTEILSQNQKKDVEITYFNSDYKKSGGEYIFVKGIIKKIDFYERCIILEDKTQIPLNAVLDING